MNSSTCTIGKKKMGASSQLWSRERRVVLLLTIYVDGRSLGHGVDEAKTFSLDFSGEIWDESDEEAISLRLSNEEKLDGTKARLTDSDSSKELLVLHLVLVDHDHHSIDGCSKGTARKGRWSALSVGRTLPSNLKAR